MSDNIIKFTRRPINEWPRKVYLADFGDGDGCRPYKYIQQRDDTTPEYIRADIFEALRAENERLRDALAACEGEASFTPHHPACERVIQVVRAALEAKG